jgi:pimeloyl-ACP methyl ester carboxylesterase
MERIEGTYVEVNGINLYSEVYGRGEPLVLIHGGLTTIEEMHGWIQPLAKVRQVIAVEMQGHGRTADTDRPMSFTTMADDIVGLLDHLRISRADVVGHSFGGAVAIRTAIQHPSRVQRLIVISSPQARSCWYPETQRGMSQVSAAMTEQLMGMSVGKFSLRWPEPQRFGPFLDKMGRLMGENYDWSEDIAKLHAQVLLVFADNDSIPQKHIAEFFALVGGGIKETGWIDPQLSKSRLAVVTGYSHYNLLSSEEVPQIVEKFLKSPPADAHSSAFPIKPSAIPPK